MTRNRLQCTSGEYQRSVQFDPGYDKRPQRPGDQNFGIHGMQIAFVLSWPAEGPVQLAAVGEVYTGWMPSTVEKAWDVIKYTKGAEARGWALAVHSTGRLDEYDFETKECGWLDGQQCWCNGGSGLAMTEVFPAFVTSGEEEIWKELQEWMEAARSRLRLRVEQSDTDAYERD